MRRQHPPFVDSGGFATHVRNHGTGHVNATEPTLTRPITHIDVLEIHEVELVESAELVEC
jgi:hypothetical protein